MPAAAAHLDDGDDELLAILELGGQLPGQTRWTVACIGAAGQLQVILGVSVIVRQRELRVHRVQLQRGSRAQDLGCPSEGSNTTQCRERVKSGPYKLRFFTLYSP